MGSKVRTGAAAAFLLAAVGGCGRAGDAGQQGAAPGGDGVAPGAGPRGAVEVAAGAAAVAAARVPVEGAPALGEATAPVTVVAFNDYECPFSKRGDAALAEVRAAYGGRVRVVARQMPLPMHERARPAALAALAAAEQGKYWAMHEQLFAAQPDLGPEGLERAARAAGLDVGRWRAAMASKGVLAALERDEALARELSVRGTPTFYVNGRAVTGARSADDFRTVVEEELGRAEALRRKGVAPHELYARLVAEAPPAAAPGAAEGGCKGGDKGGGEGCDKVECQGGGGAAAGGAEAPVEEVNVGDAPARGPEGAPVTVVVFSDFECPFCAKAEATLGEIERQYEGKVRVAFKHAPLPFHKRARLAAKAAIAAAEQGQFWAYHDALFARQGDLERPALERYAREARLRPGSFASALDAERVEARLQADLAEGQRLRIQGTPTFFINGRRLVGAQPAEAFRAAIDKELERAGR
jgi:protein-disulfide isomerase